jgi:hypothetical protein
MDEADDGDTDGFRGQGLKRSEAQKSKRDKNKFFHYDFSVRHYIKRTIGKRNFWPKSISNVLFFHFAG